MNSFLKYISPVMIFYSCMSDSNSINDKVDTPNALHSLYWLPGSWKSVTNEGTTFEIWKKENDTLFSGKSFLIKDVDTLFLEKLELSQKGNELLYIATVKGQNNDRPVAFKFTGITKGEFNFVNNAHDFPSHIIYKNPQPDFLCVRIEGKKNGKNLKEDFNFLRMVK